MSTTPSDPAAHRSSPDAVTARLRAAGCVFAEDEARLLIGAAHTPTELANMVDRRVTGEPLEYVLGWAEFCGLRVDVTRGVFVPRRRTEFLVHCAAELVRSRTIVVDLCCGSGALGAALHALRPGIELHATDIDRVAVACADRNVAGFGATYVGDLFQPLPVDLVGRVEVLLANVPYVPSDHIELLPPEARLHEARAALDGGGDGLDVLRRVAAEAPRWLAPGGHLLVETSERQSPQAMRIAELAGLTPRTASSTAFDATVVIASKAV